MNRCASHGELVGGFALGALEPAEMEEMRRHVAECPTCGPEVRRMAPLPGLLDTVQPGDVPPPAASPDVEEAILDRFTRERRRMAAPRRRLRISAAAAAVGAVAVALALVLLVSRDERETSAYASARLASLDAGSRARATAYVDAVPAGTRVTLGARGLDPDGAAYELWCVRADGEWVSGGTFRSTAGRARAQLTAAVKPGDYHVIVITRASDDGARGTPVLRGKLRY